jgi:predicted nucleic acid-binding protein
MIFVLGTNVLSEVMKPNPSIAVANWMRAQSTRSLFTASVCQAEILAGITVIPKGCRRAELEAIAQAMFAREIDGRILPFDTRAANVYADIFAKRRNIGRPIDTADLIVAASARVHDAAVVPRDSGEFDHCGLTLINHGTSNCRLRCG